MVILISNHANNNSIKKMYFVIEFINKTDKQLSFHLGAILTFFDKRNNTCNTRHIYISAGRIKLRAKEGSCQR